MSALSEKNMESNNVTQDELEDFFFELEKQWRDSLPHLSDTEWLKVFPEARGVLADKVIEWSAEKNRLIGISKQALRECNRGTAEEYTVMRLYVQACIIPKINVVEKHISRLKRQQAHFSLRPVAGRITESDIQRAREVPIASLISSNTRRTGRTITTKCPLHKERTASFVIYPESNSCWCFGCQQGGDSIALTRLLQNLSFIEAVKYLLRL